MEARSQALPLFDWIGARVRRCRGLEREFETGAILTICLGIVIYAGCGRGDKASDDSTCDDVTEGKAPGR